MSQLDARIAQFRKMTTDDPDEDMGHYRLGQLLMEAGKFDEAAGPLRRVVELNPHFSKAYQLLGETLIKLKLREEAVKILQRGFEAADERGDLIPREEMVRLLAELGQPAPVSKKVSRPSEEAGPGGFHCRRPGCTAGSYARQLAKPPMNDELGQRIQAEVCADCWNDWLRGQSIKIINEMHLDLSDERSAEIYDQIMRETLGLT